MALEIEVKFLIGNPDDLRGRLVDLGAVGQGLVAETNLVFDDSSGSLTRQRRLLRLRQTDGQTRLTVKLPPAASDRQFKVLHELEVVVDNFDTIQKMLALLGYRVRQRYEKMRETFLWKQTTFCLDALPFGHFLEIEGQKTSIMHAAAALDLMWADRILHNYLEIFEHIRRYRNLSFNDITFQNFRELKIDWYDVVKGLQSKRRPDDT